MKVIRSSVLLFFVALFITNILFSQAYNNPESAVYDATNDRYLVSNTGNGDIIAAPRTNPNNLSFFNTGQSSSIRGITIADDKVWCAGTGFNAVPNQYLYCFDLSGNFIKSILIAGGLFINDVTAGSDGTIYVSDDNSNRIFAVNPNTGGYSDLNFDGANGLLFDEANNRLLYTDDTPATGSQISAMDVNTNTASVLIVNPGFSGLDGLTVDHLGNYYVSCWSNPNAVYKYDPNFTSSVVASTGHNGVDHNGAADIFYDQVNHVLAVPNFNANTVDFIPFEQLSAENTEIDIPSEFQLHQNFPNPFNPTTTIFYDVSRESNVKVIVFDLLGREVVTLVDQFEPVGNRSINWDGRDYTGNLVNAGVYIYQIEADVFIQTKKMVLLK